MNTAPQIPAFPVTACSVSTVRWPVKRATSIAIVLGLIWSAPIIALAHESPATSAGDADDSATSRAGSFLSAREREKFLKFLTDRIKARGQSRDLVGVILGQIDAFAVGKTVPENDELHPRTTAYPSIALQIYWQQELEETASEFRLRFPTHYRPPPGAGHIQLEDLPRPLPSVEEIVYSTPEFIIRAQGDFGRLVSESPEIRRLGAKAKPRSSLGGWKVAIRIASTGNDLVDAQIRSALLQIKTEHPEAMIDAASFPAASSETNFFIPNIEFGDRTRELVGRCLRNHECSSLSDAATFSQNAKVTNGEPRKFFLENLYFSNPYGSEYGPTAVVLSDREGAIISAMCGLRDAGYKVIRRVETVDFDKLKNCIEAGMGL